MNWVKNKEIEIEKSFNKKEFPLFKYGKIIINPKDLTPVTNFIKQKSDNKTEKLNLIDKDIEIENIKSKKNFRILNLEKAYEQFPKLIENFYKKDYQNDFFSKLNSIKTTDKYFILINKDSNNKEIKINFKSKKSKSYYFMILVDGINSNIQFDEKESGDFISNEIDIIVKSSAKVNFEYISKNQTFRHIKRNAYVYKNSSIKFKDVLLKSNYTILNSTAHLLEKKSKGEHKGIFIGNKDDIYNLDIKSKHYIKETYSNILSKGVLLNNSRALFNGLIKINKIANKSIGYQKLDVLLMSKNARGDAIPNLEIDTNDVKCSHGASIGKINPEKIFYLMSRGLSEKDAKLKIIEGFIKEIYNTEEYDSKNYEFNIESIKNEL